MLKTIKSAAFFGMFFGSALAANAQIPQIQLIWNSDHTVWPPVLQSSGGGAIGGDWYPIAIYPIEPNVTYYTTKVVLTDNSNGISSEFSRILASGPFYHINGNYTLTVSSGKIEYPNGASGPSVRTTLPDQSLNFTIANPYISATLPVSPAPVLWNPFAFALSNVFDGGVSSQIVPAAPSGTPAPRSKPALSASPAFSPVINRGLTLSDITAQAIPLSAVPISVTVDGGCYSCEATVCVEIYDKDGYNEMNGLDGDLITLKQNVLLKPGKNVVNFTWNGIDKQGNMTPVGAYTFDASVYYCYGYSQPHPALSDVSNGGFLSDDISAAILRSTYNTILMPGWYQGGGSGMQVTKIFDDGLNATFSLRYVVYGGGYTPFGSDPAYDYVYDCSGGQIDVYNGATKVLTQKLLASDVTAVFNDEKYRGAPIDTVHTVNVTIPSNASDNASFILSPLDSFGPFTDSQKSRYLKQAAFRTPAKSTATSVYFDKTFIKVGHGPISGVQTVNAYVTPYSAAATTHFGVTQYWEATVIQDVSPPAHSGNAAVVKLTIVGQAAGTPVNPATPYLPTPDCQITVNGVVPSQSPNILVLIPTRIKATGHPQTTPAVHVTPRYYGLNSATSPGDESVIWDPLNPMWNITAGWYIRQTIQVVDQFGLNLDGIYTGAEVDEIFDHTPFNINSPARADGTYTDPVGGGAYIKTVNSWNAVSIFQMLAVDPSLQLSPKPSTPNIPIVVDGNNLKFGVINRTVNLTAPDLIEILWPDTP